MKVIFVAVVALAAVAAFFITKRVEAYIVPAPVVNPQVDYCLAPYNKLMFLPCSEVDRYEKA